MPVYTKASRARLNARREVDDTYGDHDEDDQDFTLLWRGPSSMPPPSRSSAPPPSRASAPPPSRREHGSNTPAPRSERPPPAARMTPPPPPSFPAPQRTEMRAQATPAEPEPPRMLELTVHERRWKIAIRAGVLLALGCVIGIGTEVLIQHHGPDVTPDPSTTSATFALQGSSVSMSSMPAPTAPVPTQCMSASVAASPLPSIENDGASIAHAVHHHRHHDHAEGTPQAAAPSDGAARPAAAAEPVLPDDIAAAAAEALSRAQQETMLP